MLARWSFLIRNAAQAYASGMRHPMIVAAFLLLVVACSSGDSPTAPAPGPLANGVWGGEHLRLQVTPSGASLEYDCGSGTIDQPLIVDGDGDFAASGRHIPGHGGPVRLGEDTPTFPARYNGHVRGDRMTLIVEVQAPGSPVQSMTYELIAGSQGRVVRCL